MHHSIQPLGDAAATVVWGDVSESEVVDEVQELEQSLKTRWRPGYECIVPAFDSLTLHYSPLVLSWSEVSRHIEEAIASGSEQPRRTQRVVQIPVCYDSEVAMDLGELAAIHQLSVEDVIRIHSAAEYSVRMIGFSPGFPYLSGLPEALATPRRSTPRLRVPAGSVAIGGNQTGIYSLETPGGWHVIGRTSVAMFRPDLDPPCLLKAGDRVRFIPISMREFQDS